MRTISGVWLPIITPFVDGAVDVRSYERLLEHYLGKGVSGVFPVGTTGESPALDDDEIDAIVERTVAVVAGRVPVFVGIGGNATHKVLKTLKRLARQRFDGIVSVCPYYNRPSQDGMLAHFTRIAEATDRPILIYNIPYRTSVNLANDTLLRLAELPNIVGVKDSSGSLAQSVDLLRRRPEDHHAARAIWSRLEAVVPLLFKEANPMPIKHCVWRQGLITSPECRLPWTRISSGLADELDRALKNAVV
ncbi:MAG: 4-hydroxy-tetrahydrodipicolinate synthase [Candidatus Rokuibacteriota bacterium]|nr:MAG: 4-hydroxy-tetrahydrodipicolinate synthase [Candidatus Rokubacteria bacterium]